ncbi:hypothetical protein KC325_g149 [Hortaea werneckii]|nr:hypothetical protein KC325_g149 [Hortaea werneckii]
MAPCKTDRRASSLLIGVKQGRALEVNVGLVEVRGKGADAVGVRSMPWLVVIGNGLVAEGSKGQEAEKMSEFDEWFSKLPSMSCNDGTCNATVNMLAAKLTPTPTWAGPHMQVLPGLH